MKSTSIKNQAQLVDEIMAEFRRTGSKDEAALENRITELVRNFYIDSHSPPSLSREVTILFSDLRGFTAMSERYEAIQIVTMLNRYFSKMNEIILKYDGLIDKYMGDAIMVLFGAPDPDINDAQRAINCAVEMQNAMNEVNNENMAQGLPELYMGIGINTGTVLAGQVGSYLHNEYTVIGDGVNLASRVESHSLRGQILISDYTYKQVKDNVLIGNINEVYVKGKSEMIKIYEIIATYWQNEMSVPHREIRTSMRVEIDTPFAFQVIENNEVLPGIHHGQAKDISYNGIFAMVQQPLEVLTNVKLSLSLSLLGSDTRDVYGKIMSFREMSDGYGCGIEFTSLDEDGQHAIKNFIDRVIGGT